jgi:hypothetical protein
MNRKEMSSRWFLVALFSLFLLFPVLLKAKNYNYQDSTKTDTTKTDTTKTDTLGYNNLGSNNKNFISNSYALNSNNYDLYKNIRNDLYMQDSSMTDTSKTDTTKSDTVGYSHSKKAFAFNKNLNSRISSKSISGNPEVNNIWRRLS